MTLPASFPLSMSQIATELGLSLPLSINHPWILQLAQKSGLPLSFSDLLGKSGRFDGNSTGQSTGGSPPFANFNCPFFGGILGAYNTAFPTSGQCQMTASTTPAPNWSGKIFVKNNTTGVSVVMYKTTWLGNPVWQVDSNPANLVRLGITDNFTITPSN
jgi:hypothetical protein